VLDLFPDTALVEGGTLSEFDRQMMSYIDDGAVLPLRFTNRHGLLGDRVNGFHEGVFVDAWQSAYVDIDDLLASSDLGLQTALTHFLRERQQTRNYARRIGTDTLDSNLPGPDKEFAAAHRSGINAELAVIRDFFGDVAQSWESFRFEATDVRDLGERVLVLGDVQARGRVSGVEVDDCWGCIVELREGRAASLRGFLDQWEALEAAGLRE